MFIHFSLARAASRDAAWNLSFNPYLHYRSSNERLPNGNSLMTQDSHDKFSRDISPFLMIQILQIWLLNHPSLQPKLLSLHLQNHLRRWFKILDPQVPIELGFYPQENCSYPRVVVFIHTEIMSQLVTRWPRKVVSLRPSPFYQWLTSGQKNRWPQQLQ